VIGANDLLIASIALAHGLIVATGNVREFQRIPGLAVEDWTATRWALYTIQTMPKRYFRAVKK
jgi:hypothetical protein